MPRTIQPELLDTLSPHHPDALHSRRDLRLINRLMGNHRWLEKTLRSCVRSDERTLEIGAGTGELSARLATAGIAMDGLDLLPSPENWPDSLTWHSADLRSFERYADYHVIVGNLVFHHFEDAELAELGRRMGGSARMIVACEPARRRISQFMFRIFGPVFGASHVTLHDGCVSIGGGFSGDELPRALGLSDSEWIIKRSVSLVGLYRMIATRRS
jgi:2-polyprenyl-3-methyl-5-hydroxy-6-metoxy-1,4-benzoquinol methylase